ncbi:hemerythrin domain-containing protein [Pseudomonas borbori]|uniref:Hemerythrin HHE cation binding domain-containing protein n=1 Tax=Pseudomonas borbori TaxID=289003 RepID=A0A1I5TMV5_9PSED|nr:hemerythrin domain-containing protein [Pseudomonas borbori]SFP84424.1 Hemerythrin HHE cation binding domain-containing protein [Pseudomonas borbori]
MHPLLEELHRYHQNISATIDQMKGPLDKLKNDAGDAADRQQLFALLESLHGEAETRHHQNEELIRRLLLTTRAPAHPRVLEIERDHQGFARIAARLKALEHSNLTQSEIATFIEDYISKYYDHLDSEEYIFFPLADEWLSDNHWQEIKQQWQTSGA